VTSNQKGSQTCIWESQLSHQSVCESVLCINIVASKPNKLRHSPETASYTPNPVSAQGPKLTTSINTQPLIPTPHRINWSCTINQRRNSKIILHHIYISTLRITIFPLCLSFFPPPKNTDVKRRRHTSTSTQQHIPGVSVSFKQPHSCMLLIQ